MPDLRLNLKGMYFDQIKSGEKLFEYRLVNDYWKKRLVGKRYDRVIFLRGYPKAGDEDKTIVRPYAGYEIQTLTHPHFGKEEVTVFAIHTGGHQ